MVTVKVTGVRLFFQRFSLVFYLGQIGIRLFGKKIGVGSLIMRIGAPTGIGRQAAVKPLLHTYYIYLLGKPKMS